MTGSKPQLAGAVDLFDSDEEQGLWISPSEQHNKPRPREAKDANSNSVSSDVRNGESTFEKQEAKKEALQRELESVRKVNEVIEGVIESLDKAKNNMRTVNSTVHSASTLLNTWTRILSQTEHVQRLTLNPAWQGASQDIMDMERDAAERQQAVRRMETEEQERRLAEAEKVKDEERRRAEAVTKDLKPSTRGRVRGFGRGSSIGQSSTTGYVGVGGQPSSRGNARGSQTEARRGASRIGRGAASSRGKGRGS